MMKMHSLKKCGFALLIGLCISSAHAARDPAFDGFMQHTVGNNTTIKFGSDGTARLASSRPLGIPAIGQFGMSRTNEGLFMSSVGGVSIPNQPAKTIPVQAKVRLTGDVIAKTLTRALPFVAAWQAGSALHQIWSDAGMAVNSQTGIVTDIEPLSNLEPSSGFIWGDGHIHQGLTSNAACMSFATTLAGPNARCRFHAIPSNGVGRQYSILDSGGSWTGRRITVWPIGPSQCPAGNFISNGQCVASPHRVVPSSELHARISQLASVPTDMLRDSVVQALSIPEVQPAIIPEIIALPVNVDFPGGVQSVEVAEPHIVTRTRVLPNGDTETITETTTQIARVQPATSTASASVNWSQQTQTRSVVKTPAGVVVSDSITESKTEPLPQPPQITCGLPGTPPCRIFDEDVPAPRENDGESSARLAMLQFTTCVNNLEDCLPDLPDLNLTFTLPSNCGIIKMPAFEPYLPGIDVCRWQAIFHDIMTMLWLTAGIFGAISIINRTT